MFIDQDDLIDVVIYYKKVGKQYAAYNQKAFSALKLNDEEKKVFQSVTLKMKQLTWGIHNELQDLGYVTNHNNEKIWSYKHYKENRLKKLIVSWDAKKSNAKGEMEPVPLNESTILSLSPDIAEAILITYDDLTLLGVDEEKK